MTLVSGKKVLKEANSTSAGAADAGKLIALDASGQIDPSLVPSLEVKSVESFEDLDSGDFVNLFLDGGVIKARKADNSNGRPAHGFIKDTTVAPAVVNVFESDFNTNLSGLTTGDRVYLGTTGDIIQAPLDENVDTGKIHQYLGIATSATEMLVEIQDCIEL